jgi:hypothetical protein
MKHWSKDPKKILNLFRQSLQVGMEKYQQTNHWLLALACSTQIAIVVGNCWLATWRLISGKLFVG